MLILLLFFCSGATALIYELLWSKYLTLLFGSTVQAQTVVLAIFMGGLALGNRLFGRWADRTAQPLAIYGFLEVAVGLWAFCFSSLYKGADAVFASAGSGLLEHSGWLLGLKAALSAALLLAPTVLMGGTLPLLAAWLQKNTPDAGRRSARFYSTNSLGAVLGAGLAGFFLVTWLGLPVTVQMTGLANVMIGFTAVGLAKRRPARQANREQVTEVQFRKPAAVQDPSSLLLRGCLLVALTGAVSMGLEVLASRCLCLIFGASLQAFAVVLMAFILGIGLGSAVIASPRRSAWPNETMTLALALGAAAWLGLLMCNIETLVNLYRYARSALNSNAAGYGFHQFMTGGLAMLVLGIPASALGAVLPLWIRAVSEDGNLLGERVGRLLTWNTLGAVGGVLITGFVLMPGLGLRGSFATLALVLAGAAVLVALSAGQRRAALAAGGVAGLLAAVAATGGEQWRLVLSSGVFRWREAEVSASAMKARLGNSRLVFYEDAADATVSVEDDGPVARPRRSLRVNGKPDASNYGDLSTQLLLAHLPLMARPDSKDVFVFGMGSGITAGSVLGHPIERLTVAENCEPVLRAAKLFEAWNHGVLTHPDTHIIREDARTVLKLSPHLYDVIIAEPSNPWAVGVGSVFSREFYELAARRLKPGGVMAQWFHVYEMSDGLEELVVRTFASVFPVMEIWDANTGDLILLGSKTPWPSDRQACQRLFALPGPREELARVGLPTPEALLARQVASQRTAFAVAGPGPLQTDDYPILEYAAPRAFFIGAAASAMHLYDERTWQAGIAPGEKSSLLAGLSEASLKAIFGEFKSVNPDVKFYLSHLNGKGGVDFEPVGGGLTAPCSLGLFRGLAFRPPPMAATNELARALFEAERSLQADPAKRSQAVQQIWKILDATGSYDEGAAGWSATYYTCLAAEASLALEDGATAKKILLRGLRLEPGSELMQYLARIMIRERILRPEELLGGTDDARVQVAASKP